MTILSSLLKSFVVFHRFYSLLLPLHFLVCISFWAFFISKGKSFIIVFELSYKLLCVHIYEFLVFKYKNSSLNPKDSFYFYYATDKNHSNFIKTTFLRLKKGLNSNAHNCSGRGNFCHKVLSFVLVHAMLAFSFSRLGHQSFTIMIKISFMGKFFCGVIWPV